MGVVELAAVKGSGDCARSHTRMERMVDHSDKVTIDPTRRYAQTADRAVPFTVHIPAEELQRLAISERETMKMVEWHSRSWWMHYAQIEAYNHLIRRFMGEEYTV